jgi:hypothetical protein
VRSPEIGVKNLDVYTFYAEDPAIRYRTDAEASRTSATQEHGRHPDDYESVGRRVELLGRTLKVSASADPVSAVRSYLRAGGTSTAKELSKKAVVVSDPGARFSQVIWAAP